MVHPKLKGLSSPELDRDALPADSGECSVLCEAEIGGADTQGADIFHFTVVTPGFLLQEGEARWGRGYLLLPEFSWTAVEDALEKLLMHAARPTWEEVAAELNKELQWEFDNYRE